MSSSLHIIILDSSHIIFEGLAGIVIRIGIPVKFLYARSLAETEKMLLNHKNSLVIVNPALIQNNNKAFNSLKKENLLVKWIALIYAYFDSSVISQFDAVINISDSPETIAGIIKKTVDKETPVTGNDEILSERETDVLRLLTSGLANKEIADQLNISINTVITHRRNISHKTGIKSLSGLTVYAVVKKIISLDNLLEH